MTKTLLSEVAYAMEAPECLLPHLPYLLQDLPSLSGGEDEVVEVLREVGFPKSGTVLDLGCGRGDIAIRVARAFDAKVTGVDGHSPFIEIARQSAKEAGLQHRCQFVADDLRKWLAKPARFDAVMMIAVGPLLGDPAKTMGLLRAVVRDGGWIIIDDGYLEDGVSPPADYEDLLEQGAMEAELTQFGDAIVARRIGSPAWRSFNALSLETIPKRAVELIELYPELKDAIDQYVARQFREVALMDGPVVPALWAIQKTAA
ncbi:SAM-dependent methyltransferase [Denitrobaculum tricleocarpae]|uniref:Class I SAM-dependent methyltransferase n=1 Tax=Denitrobaculum tricleocarpae TaxID=2591009 RepID=A0A545TTC5_9PROT|nr:class I SAM-dependent methyltransferase [Denitrobaculum tricleocarpae]TQV80466.1 class I SAM-dependent methyltransferase [Denitrobaculum tricleocarpae]